MNLDQFIKYYTDHKNLKTFNYNSSYNCPLCKEEISNSKFCNKSVDSNTNNHDIYLELVTPSIKLYFDKNYDYIFFKDYFNVISSASFNKGILKSLYYKDFGEVTLEKLKKLENNLLFL
jgi:hypothetical protein